MSGWKEMVFRMNKLCRCGPTKRPKRKALLFWKKLTD